MKGESTFSLRGCTCFFSTDWLPAQIMHFIWASERSVNSAVHQCFDHQYQDPLKCLCGFMCFNTCSVYMCMFQAYLWRLGTRAAAQLLHGGAHAIHRSNRSRWRGQLPCTWVAQSGATAPSTTHQKPRFPRACTHPPKQTTRTPVPRPPWGLR